MTPLSVCISCRRPQAQYACGLCADPVCRSCAVFLAQNSFSFRAEVKEELQHLHYCPRCHGEHVEPELDSYRDRMVEAEQVFFFFEGRKKPIQVLKKAVAEVTVPQCADRNETILRLGFLAAEQGFNAIVDAEVSHTKLRENGYQRTHWRGRGMPATVDREKLERHDY